MPPYITRLFLNGPGIFFLFAFLALSSGCIPTSQTTEAQDDSTISSPLPLEQDAQGIQQISRYLTMRDGVKIAIDLYLPASLKQGEKIPTMVHQTRYWRAVNYRWLVSLFKETWPRGIIGTYAKRFLENGYAWVDVDVRGSGASFGTRPTAFSAAEILDGAEIVDWIIGQPWSNGKVGAMGISYSGGTAELLLVNQHPAVKAVAPMFSGFDL